jgi:putative DNA primase/helicase
MTNTSIKFDPLTPANEDHPTRINSEKENWQIISPVPNEASLQIPKHRLGEPSEKWHYLDSEGQMLFAICRFDTETGKEVLPLSYGQDEKGPHWKWKGHPDPRPLYGLDRLAARPDSPVIICEGEKAADNAEEIFPDLVAVTSSGGSKAAMKSDWSPLNGREVTIWGDHDEPGRVYASKVAELASAAGAKFVRLVQTPGEFPDGWDLADPLPNNWTSEQLAEHLDQAETYQPKPVIYIPSGFRFTEKGVEKSYVKDGEVYWDWICSHLEVCALSRSFIAEDWGQLLLVNDPDDNAHEWLMPMAMTSGDGSAYREQLLSLGLRIAPGSAARKYLGEYIVSAEPKERVRGVSRIGWHKNTFVLPDATYGNTAEERIIFQTKSIGDHAFRSSGSLEEWNKNIGRKCIGNTRLIFAVSTALAAPLLHIANEEGGGIHIVGESRSGKTTALNVAGSVWGGGGINGFLRTWRATSNGLESTAQAHCDTLLCLDEIGQVDGREAGDTAYMLANGSGKSRARRDGSGRPPAQWHLLFLSTGEISLSDKMIESGKKPRAGQEVRLADLPADAGASMGIFEDLHDYTSPEDMARQLGKATSKYYGTPSTAFLEKLTAMDHEEIAKDISKARKDFMEEYVPPNPSGQVLSVAGRFALIAAAGTLATSFEILDWPQDEAYQAAGVCFQGWLERRGGVGASEIDGAFKQIRRFFEAHGMSRFEPIGDATEMTADGNSIVRTIYDRAGFRKLDEKRRCEYLVLPETYKHELCKGFDHRTITKALLDVGALLTDKDGKPQPTHRIPLEGTFRLYHFSGSFMEKDAEGIDV